MSLRRWFRDLLLMDDDSGGADVPPGSALMEALFGDDRPPPHHLGEYNSRDYPSDLRELLARRDEVASELLSLRAFDPESRIAAVPALHALLLRYPHPLVYETLINASLDAGRLDEARGLAFAARQRHLECSQSDHPEIRAEVDWMREWDAEDFAAPD
ncbi:MAG: hypothetical protein LBG44_05005 [Gemmatimonadota bacterium]|jgi:hypothetical protein|nr:hypothetical protein [Gemmatimonadota bacterium]